MGITKTILATLLLIAFNSQAQNKIENGQKTGHWIIKDANNFICAEGNYKDDARVGPWKFYISQAARKSQSPDVTGSYTNGVKQGAWIYGNDQTLTNVKVHFENDLMQGECLYFDKNQSILARGLLLDGIRHGKWIFYDANSPTGAYHASGYKLNKKTTEGYYKDGFRIGQWDYDYYLDANTHVKGHLTFEKGVNSGRLDFFKVDNHPTFGKSELLAGSGSFVNGKKTGRWIEFNYGTKGDFIETGAYDAQGKRDGMWKVRIGHQTYLSGTYNHGIPHGRFNHYYESGQLKYESSYNNGLEEGEFKRYYQNGQVQEQGTHVIIDDETTRDTTFVQLKLPYEHSFLIVEEDFANMHCEYITWLHEPAYSIAPSELSRRFNLFRTYGHEDSKRIVNINVRNKKTVREGEYLAFYENGNLRLKGSHSPLTASLFDPNKRSVELGFARDGEWKEYGPDKMLKNTYIYEQGKLKKMLDANGYIVHTFKYEQNGAINMIDLAGNTVSVDLRIK